MWLIDFLILRSVWWSLPGEEEASECGLSQQICNVIMFLRQITISHEAPDESLHSVPGI